MWIEDRVIRGDDRLTGNVAVYTDTVRRQRGAMEFYTILTDFVGKGDDMLLGCHREVSLSIAHRPRHAFPNWVSEHPISFEMTLPLR